MKTGVEQLVAVPTVEPVVGFENELEDELEEENPDTELERARAIPMEPPPLEPEVSIPSDVTQWLTRSLTVDGEIIEGGVRIEFENGQRRRHGSHFILSSLAGVRTSPRKISTVVIWRFGSLRPFRLELDRRSALSNSLSDGKRIRENMPNRIRRIHGGRSPSRLMT